MSDAYYLRDMNWKEYAEQEKEKIERVYKDVDVMVTHINPSIDKEYINKSYREEDTAAFFTFDGLKYLTEGSMKYWIYGHTHLETEHQINGVKCICNPMGYPSENGNGEWTWIKSIDIEETYY